MDFDINSVTELLSTTDETLGAADRALGSVEKASSIIKRIKGFLGASEAGGDADVKAAIADLTNEIADAKLANADLKIKLAALQLALLEANKRESQLDRYTMTDTPAGRIVYQRTGLMKRGEPTHFACPNCYQDGRVSILQGGDAVKRCPKCKMDVRFQNARARTIG